MTSLPICDKGRGESFIIRRREDGIYSAANQQYIRGCKNTTKNTIYSLFFMSHLAYF
jgi:hypothetical protein